MYKKTIYTKKNESILLITKHVFFSDKSVKDKSCSIKKKKLY